MSRIPWQDKSPAVLIKVSPLSTPKPLASSPSQASSQLLLATSPPSLTLSQTSVELSQPLLASCLPPPPPMDSFVTSSSPPKPVTVRPFTPLQRTTRKGREVSVSESPKTIMELFRPSINIALAPTGIQSILSLAERQERDGTGSQTTMSRQELQELQGLLREQLGTLTGTHRAQQLYRSHAQQNHFLLLYTEDDCTKGEELRRLLEEEGARQGQGISVAGPWSVTLGELTLEAWERLSGLSQEVLVLVSQRLLQDTELTNFLMKMYEHSITPLYLDPVLSLDFPPYLASLRCRNGRSIHENNWDPQIFASDLVSHYNFSLHLSTEINNLQRLVEKHR